MRMRLMIQIILTGLCSYFIELWLPAWAIVICAAVITMCIPTNLVTSFLGGFIAISLLWMCKATIIDVYTHSILSTKIILLLGFQSPMMLILLTGLVGGMLGGLGSIIGQQMYKLLQK